MSARPSPVTTGIAAPLQQRLSEQLESLSQVGELLTLRLLELEERLEGLERHMAQLPVEMEPDSADTGSLLAATDERISRLEELLSGGGQGLQLVPEPAPEPVAATLEEGEDAGFDEPELELHPFPEEDEEQPFMDELSA
ncbi:MAG: hypothetical protein RLZZ533_531 [Cyanobacteriota bacterium]|jgi:hypothetical protein